ncbi:hypothetical protein SMATCC274_15100 [Serratia marcescens]|nr:hypothetical protein SMATCC274_15100 [Serratia marcescens]
MRGQVYCKMIKEKIRRDKNNKNSQRQIMKRYDSIDTTLHKREKEFVFSASIQLIKGRHSDNKTGNNEEHINPHPTKAKPQPRPIGRERGPVKMLYDMINNDRYRGKASEDIN